MYSPLETRRALSRLFKHADALWTWISGLAMPGARPAEPWRASTHVWALLLVYVATLVFGLYAVAGLLEAIFPASAPA
jgi:hypothetical protein